MPNEPSDPAQIAAEKARAKRMRRTAMIATGMFVAMCGAAFAAVPLYRAFCQATGFDGTVRKAELKPSKVLDKTVVVRFDTNVSGLPWKFTADQVAQTIHIGDTGLAFFKVTNTSDKPVTGRATYNVVPEQVGSYFQKLECFCFTAQTLQPGQTVHFPVVYFIDPRFATDFETRNATEVTLSYTFYPAIAEKDANATGAKGA